MAKAGTLASILKAYLFATRYIRMKNITNDDFKEKIMLFDRYVPSTLAYRADLGFFIDITPEESIKRNTDTKINIKASAEHLAKVRNAYLSNINENNLIHVNGMQPIEYIFDEIISNIEEYRKRYGKRI